jgi:formate C-acetyltransferase
LQSVFTADCIERGQDIDRGGARYNWVECSFVGMANLVDSLHVIRREVFEERRLDFTQLKQILDANFSGHESERQRFLHGHAKYGHADAGVDGLITRVLECVKRECRVQRVGDEGAPFVPGAFCWVMHEWLGRECGATPDGRLGGTPFADGCGPAQGRETKGPTAGILSTTSWAHHPLIGGAAYNMRFMKSLFASPAARDGLKDLLVTFLQRGGFEVQVNAVDAEVLKKAQERPTEYADLVVRIGGYTDYFTRLSPQMQAEVMQRTEFARI